VKTNTVSDQYVRQGTFVSGGIRFMRIFAKVPARGGIN